MRVTLDKVSPDLAANPLSSAFVTSLTLAVAIELFVCGLRGLLM